MEYSNYAISKRDRLIILVLSVVAFIIIFRPIIAYLNAWRGEQYLHLNDKKESIIAFKKAVLLDPTNASYYSFLAYLYQSSDKNKAISLYKKAIKLDPKEHDNYFYLGLILFEQKKYYLAEGLFKKSLKLEKKHLLSHRMLVNVYDRTGRFEKAISELKELKRMFPEIEAKERIKKIEDKLKKREPR
ncbi:MAG: tetratricopeptide repeat protein [Actinobacteria bacterium]|nr:tetratricopeptide repeat protein [Actinomycetota bacterium]